jgi:membrane-bound lytic murein transglycosylase B
VGYLKPSPGTASRPLTAGIEWTKEVVLRSSQKQILFVLALVFVFAAIPAFASPAPSKTAVNQSVASRDADLALVRDAAAGQQVAAVLTAHGISQEQVNQKLAQMSPQDLHQLARNLDQLQAAGLTRQEWIWIGVGALAAVILVAALTQ